MPTRSSSSTRPPTLSAPSTALTSSFGRRPLCVCLSWTHLNQARFDQLIPSLRILQEVVARIGRRRGAVNGSAAAAADDAMDVDPATASTSAALSHSNGQPAEQPEASTSAAASSLSKPASKAKSPAAAVLVGPELDRALDRGEDVEVSWPFRGPEAWSDWRGIEALWCAPYAALRVQRRHTEISCPPTTGSTHSPLRDRFIGHRTTRPYL